MNKKALKKLTIRPQVLTSVGTQGQIIVRYFHTVLKGDFVKSPEFIEILALDTTEQAVNKINHLNSENFINFTSKKTPYVLKNLENFSEISKWYPGSRYDKMSTGHGSGGERSISALHFALSYPRIAQRYSEIMDKFRANELADLAARCNNDSEFRDKGLRVASDDGIDSWIVATSPGATAAATMQVAAMLHQLAESKGISINLNLLLLLPAVKGDQLSYTERHRLVNSYSSLNEIYSNYCTKIFETEIDNCHRIKYSGQLFQSILLLEPGSSSLEKMSKLIGEVLLPNFIATPMGKKYHDLVVDNQQRVFGTQGDFNQFKIFSSVGISQLDAIPINAENLAKTLTLSSLWKEELTVAHENISEDAKGIIEEAGLTTSCLKSMMLEHSPFLPPNTTSRRKIEKFLIQYSLKIKENQKSDLEQCSATLQKTFNLGKQILDEKLDAYVKENGLAPACKWLQEIILAIQNENRKVTNQQSKIKITIEKCDGILRGSSHPTEKLKAFETKYTQSLHLELFDVVRTEYERCIRGFEIYTNNFSKLRRYAENQASAFQNELKFEEYKFTSENQPHLAMSLDKLKSTVQNILPDSSIVLRSLLAKSIKTGEFSSEEKQEFSQKITAIVLKRISHLRNLDYTFSLMNDEEMGEIITQAYDSANPTPRLRGYLENDVESHTLLNLPGSESSLLQKLNTLCPNIVTTQNWFSDRLVFLRLNHGIEPSALEVVHESHKIFMNEMIRQYKGGNSRVKLYPYIDKRFKPEKLVIPPLIERQILLLIPLSLEMRKGPISYDPQTGNYVYTHQQNSIPIGNTRSEAYSILAQRDVNRRLKNLPSLSATIQEVEALIQSFGNLADSVAFLGKLQVFIENQAIHDHLVSDRLMFEYEMTAIRLYKEQLSQQIKYSKAIEGANNGKP